MSIKTMRDLVVRTSLTHNTHQDALAVKQGYHHHHHHHLNQARHKTPHPPSTSHLILVSNNLINKLPPSRLPSLQPPQPPLQPPLHTPPAQPNTDTPPPPPSIIFHHPSKQLHPLHHPLHHPSSLLHQLQTPSSPPTTSLPTTYPDLNSI